MNEYWSELINSKLREATAGEDREVEQEFIP